MRINVYGEELTHDIEIVHKDKFVGIRFYLHSTPQLHNNSLDDDRSAVTFWVPWTQEFGNDDHFVSELLHKAQQLLLQDSYNREINFRSGKEVDSPA